VGLILIRIFNWITRQGKLLVSDVIIFILFIPSAIFFLGGNLLGVIASPDNSPPTAVNYPSLPIVITETPTVVSYPTSPIIITETPTPIIPTVTAIPPVATSVIIIQPTATINAGSYVLHRGEFMYCIARRFNVHPDQLFALNGYVNGQTVSEGTLLYIPQGGESFPGNRSLLNHPAIYTVASLDETLFSIACRFGDVDPSAIAQANGITTSTSLTIGQQLNIP